MKHDGTANTYFVSKDFWRYLYIVQLIKYQGTDIYKIGRTIYMKQRLMTCKQYDGGSIEIVRIPVSNQYKTEVKLLQLIN